MSLTLVGLTACEQKSSPTPPANSTSSAESSQSETTAPAATDTASPSSTTPQIGAADMNVLLVSVDTTRADHLGCYGHPVVKTPNIDRMAAEGVRFAECISSAPLTLPSHSTMLTGCQPYVHGARDNGIFILADENTTLPEVFKQAGYATHGEVAALVLGRRTHIQQGFDTFGDVEAMHPEIGPWSHDKKDFAAQLSVETGGPDMEQDQPEVEPERKAEEITNRGIELLTQSVQAGDKFFMFLHYFDPHWPHEAPERFASQYEEGYYAEIAYFDEQFGRLLQAVRDLGLAGNTLVILISDHGEGRGQHGEQTHSTFLYDSTLHVPLIMWCPGQVPAGRVVEQQVCTVDVASTILAFTRLEKLRPEQMQGSGLLPLMSDSPPEMRLPAYSDTMVPRVTYGYCPLRSIRVDGWKYILSPSPELYHVAEDPMELFNVAAAEPTRAAEMRRELRDIIADSPSPPGSRGAWESVDQKQLQRLEALGYVSSFLDEDPVLSSGSELEYFEPEGINPRDRMEVVNCMATGLGQFRVGWYEECEKTWRRFCELEPTNPAGPSYLGRLCTIEERYDEAVEWYRRTLELDPRRSNERRSLGHALAMLHRDDEAIEAYRIAASQDPTDIFSRLNCAKLLAKHRQFDDALTLIAEAEKADNTEPAVYFERGMTYKAMQSTEDALTAFRKAAEIKPGFQRAYGAIAGTLRQAGRLDEAIEYLEGILKEHPKSALLFHGLAECYVAKSDLDKAGECFVRVTELLPKNAAGWSDLGGNLIARGKAADAVEPLRKAVEFDAGSIEAWMGLATAYEQTEQADEATKAYDQLVEERPRGFGVYTRYADFLDRQGRRDRAVEVLRAGREQIPNDPTIANDLAWRLATSADAALRNGEQAVALAEQAAEAHKDDNAGVLDTLAAAYAAVGRFDEAVATAKRAVDAANDAKLTALAERIGDRMKLYEQHTPFVDQ